MRVVDGVVAGVWEHERRGAELVVTVRPFAALTDAVRTAAEALALRYAALLDATVLRVDWAVRCPTGRAQTGVIGPTRPTAPRARPWCAARPDQRRSAPRPAGTV
ncbi:MAG: hypothetical protein V7646_4651 [Pseudonocardia sp.]